MENELLAYPVAGCVNMHSGRDWFEGHGLCPYCQSPLKDVGDYHAPARNLTRANDPEFGPMICMRCFNRGSHPDLSRPTKIDEDGRQWYYPQRITPGMGACLLAVSVCERCGWWFVIEDADQCNDGFAATYCGILQSFDVRSATVPLEVLQYELPKNLHRIDEIHPKRMEDLVGRILAGAHDCEVHQLGYTRDGGIDLILLDGDVQIAVQVKRREDHKKTEPVTGIREFLGAALLGGFDDLIYVTNAQRFSPEANAAAEKAVAKGLTRSFELISRQKLNDLLRREPSEAYWADALRAVVKGQAKMPDVPDPFTLSATTDENRSATP